MKIKRGRPTKTNRASHVIALRLTREEMTRICTAANQKGLPAAVFARMAVLDAT